MSFSSQMRLMLMSSEEKFANENAAVAHACVFRCANNDDYNDDYSFTLNSFRQKKK